MYSDEFTYYRPENDIRLINVSQEVRRLRDAIDTLEWEGEDASHFYQIYKTVLAEHRNGTRFLPLF